nr:hypothetical protein [Tanacetum cinerariifolium]
MSRDVITVGSTMRIPLLYRREYSQWRERFMNYLEEQTDGEVMIYSIKNGDQLLPVIAQVSLAGTTQNAPPTLKDPKFWTAEEKKTRKIDRLARSLLIQGLSNDIYSLIDSNETAKDIWDALERQMHGSEYGEQDRKAVILYEYETFKANEGEQLLDTYLRYLQVVNDLKKCGYKKDNYVNDALGYKKKAVVVHSDPLALVAEKTNSANKKQEFVKMDDKKVEKKADEKKRDLSKVKCYNCKKEGHFAKDYKQAKVKDYNYYKTKMLLAKKDSEEQMILAEEKAWMESSSDSDQEINANMVFMAQIEKVLSESDESSSSAKETIVEVDYYTSESKSESEFKTSEYYDNYTNYGLFVNNDDDQEIFHDAIESASENFIENHIDSQKDYDKSEEKNNEFNDQIKVLNEKYADLLDQTKVLKDQLQVKHVVIDTHVECHEKYAKLKEERYEYMIRYSTLFDNDKKHKKQIADQEVLFDKISVELVELDKHVRDLKNTVLEKGFKISELKECVRNKDLEIEKCLERLNDCENKLHKMGQTNQTVHMIMPSKDNLYNGRKGIGFKNPRYFEKAKDLRPSLYDEKVIGLGYTLMFLTHSDKALEIEKFKRSKENKIEFVYDYRNMNASYVNEKINFKDDYFQEIINPDFEKIDSPF